MSPENAWIKLPRSPDRTRVYARRESRLVIHCELGERPQGPGWEFVGWFDNSLPLAPFREACREALTAVERALTAALDVEGPDNVYGLASSGIANESSVYRAVRGMIGRLKVAEAPLFTAREHRHQISRPKRVLHLTEAG